MIASRQIDRVAQRSCVMEDVIEDSHIQAERVSPTSSHKMRMVEQTDTPQIMWYREGRIEGRVRDLADELDDAIVDGAEITAQEVEFQDGMQVVAKTQVTRTTKIEALADMEMAHQDDTKEIVMADMEADVTDDMEVTPSVDRQATTPASTDSFVHTDEGFLEVSMIVPCSPDFLIMWH